MKRVLGIETSCDETAVAVVEADGAAPPRVLGEAVASQIEKHKPFGGVVPEVAVREHLHHLPQLVPQVLLQAGTRLSQLDAISVTEGPGLAPCLLIGNSYARALAVSTDKVIGGVNHLEGHLFSPFLSCQRKVEFPFVGLIVSGGHTLLVTVYDWDRYVRLGATADDAAGEAFDKIARLLGFPYPGGPSIEHIARSGNPDAYDFPRAFPDKSNFNFSFSGLKTSVRYFYEKNPQAHKDGQWVADICASFQRAVVDVIAQKSVLAVKHAGGATLAASGGVVCNGALRQALQLACTKNGIELLLADPELCTDNAVMIAATAAMKFEAGREPKVSTDINPGLSLFTAEPTGELARGLAFAQKIKHRSDAKPS